MKSGTARLLSGVGAGILLFAITAGSSAHSQHKIANPYIPNDHRPLKLHAHRQSAAAHRAHASARSHAATAALICPVTGDKIASVKAAVGHSAFKGKTYYFCCAGCKPRFDKNPAKFARDSAAGKFEKM